MIGEGHICYRCIHAPRCRWLLGPGYSPAGPCDWDPPSWRLALRAPARETRAQQRQHLRDQGAAVGEGAL